MDPQTVSTLLGTWGYPALLLLLVLTGVGSPIPEDLLLIIAGYLVFSDVFQWPATLAISLAGVVTSDFVLYSAGRHVAWRSAQWSDTRVISRDRLERTARWFSRVGDRLVFIARLVPGTRAMVFLAAGASAVPIGSFLRYDVMGALLWVPVMLVVGHASGSRIGDIEQALTALNRSAVWVTALAIVLLIMWLSWGREESKL